MFKTAFGVIALSNLLTSFVPIDAYASVNVCTLKAVHETEESSRVDLTIGERHISIIGWRHTSSRDTDSADMDDLLNKAMIAVKEKNCEKSGAILKTLLLHPGWHHESAQNLMQELRNVTASFQPDVLGVEHTEKGLGIWRPHLELRGKVLLRMGEQCPGNLALINNLTLLYPGPEFLFAQARSEMIKIAPLEEADTRAVAQKAADELNLLKPLVYNQMKPTAEIALKKLFKNMREGHPVNQTEVSAVLAAQGAGEMANLIADHIKATEKLFSQNPIRNEKMADKILAGSGSYVVVVGNTHVQHLAQRIQTRCLAEERKTDVSAATANAVKTLTPVQR